jgi:cephalosporin hydroxylase
VNEVVTNFHKLYYDSNWRTWKNTYWLGVPVQKCPLDLWIYQEILWKVRPDVIIETGTYDGGSAYFLAHICDMVGKGRVVTIDIEPRPERPQHPRLQYMLGSSTNPDVVASVRQGLDAADVVLVILDSDHSAAHVSSELRTYWDLVSPGSYLIVEDTNINGNPILPDFGPGAKEAVDAFMTENKDFVLDQEMEKFFMTFNPGGYLRRVVAAPPGSP